MAEDDADAAECLRGCIEQIGYSVAVCAEGSEALRLVREWRPDLVLLNAILPMVPEGRSVGKCLREHFDVPILCLVESAAVPDALAAAADLGPIGYLVKPFDPGMVSRMIQAAVTCVQTRQSLRESVERYQRIFESLRDAVFVIDREGHICEANPAAAEQYGYTLEQLTSMTVDQLVHPNCRHILKRFMADLHAGRTAYCESVDVRSDGAALPVQVQAVPFTWKGEPHFLGMIRDVTQWKRAQQQVLEHQQRLRQLVLELSTAEDRERRQLAEDLHDRVGQTLAAVQMGLQLLRATSLDAPQRVLVEENLQLLRQVAKDTRTLTFELYPPALREHGLAAAVEALVDQFAAASSASLQLDYDQSPLPLPEPLPGLVYRCVRELISNAMKYSRAEHIRVYLRGIGDRMRVVVEDDGVGFDPRTVDLAGRTGTGFGLFSIRERMREVGGTLKVDSRPEGGTRAELDIPLHNPGLRSAP